MRYLLPRICIEKLYKSFVRSLLDYADVIYANCSYIHWWLTDRGNYSYDDHNMAEVEIGRIAFCSFVHSNVLLSRINYNI